MRSNIARFGVVAIILALGWETFCSISPAAAMSFDETPVIGTPVYAPRISGTHVTGTPTTQTPVNGTAVAATPIGGSSFAAMPNRWDFDSSHRTPQQNFRKPIQPSPCTHATDPHVRCGESPGAN